MGLSLTRKLIDAHLVAGKAVAVQLVVTVDEEETHRSHFLRRARETRNRPPERYLEFAQRLTSRRPGVRVVLTGGPDEAAFNRELIAAWPGFVDAGTAHSIDAFAGTIAACDCERSEQRGRRERNGRESGGSDQAATASGRRAGALGFKLGSASRDRGTGARAGTDRPTRRRDRGNLRQKMTKPQISPGPRRIHSPVFACLTPVKEPH